MTHGKWNVKIRISCVAQVERNKGKGRKLQFLKNQGCSFRLPFAPFVNAVCAEKQFCGFKKHKIGSAISLLRVHLSESHAIKPGAQNPVAWGGGPH